MNGDREGEEVVYWVEGMNDPIVNFHLKPETYEQAFSEAGFSEMEWCRVFLDLSEKNNPYWDEFFAGQPLFIATTTKK